MERLGVLLEAAHRNHQLGFEPGAGVEYAEFVALIEMASLVEPALARMSALEDGECDMDSVARRMEMSRLVLTMAGLVTNLSPGHPVLGDLFDWLKGCQKTIQN